MEKWFLYDTTLRDGLQQKGLEISVGDAVKLARSISKIGAGWIEAGFASAGSDQMERIRALVKAKIPNVKIAAFGRTRGTKETVKTARDLQAILKSGAETATLVGKSRERDAKLSLKTTPDGNLKLIKESIEYIKGKGLEVIFDAEHYFDGVKDNCDYTGKVIETVYKSGADWIVLCDTNGGSTADDVILGIELAAKSVPIEKLGFHGHDDRGRAVSNSEAAFSLGVRHIQGTINGYGERCGNTNLCTLVPNLFNDFRAVPKENFDPVKLTPASRLASDLLNAPRDASYPWVGELAFYSEAGMHVSGLLRDPSSYLHADPETVGNSVSIGVSEQSGRSNIAVKARELGFNLTAEEVAEIAKLHDQRAREGYSYISADASFALLIVKTLKPKLFNHILPRSKWRVISHYDEAGSKVEAVVEAEFNGADSKQIGFGDGPVDALNSALKKIIGDFYPNLPNFQLSDYRVRAINPEAATAAKVRVVIETTDGKSCWTTVGVNENIIEASWIALLDSVAYAIFRSDSKTRQLA